VERLEATDASPAGVVDAAPVARAIALLDRGLVDDARVLLSEALAAAGVERFADAAPGLSAADFDGARDDATLADAELESAFDDARPETDAMIDADGIAFEAIRRARLDEPESVALPAPDSPFHTRTMADLLERQGDAASARAIRSALAPDARADAGAADGDLDAETRARTIQTLERWLARLRGGDA
jgi:hypothetical protein